MSDTFSVWRGDIPADRFMIITNDFMRGKLPVPLRALARCLLGHLLSLPAEWDMFRSTLDESVLEGRDAVDRALRELETAGYLQRLKQHDTTAGRWKWAWRVTDDPVARPLPPCPENPSMGSTSENTTFAQVAPCPGNPVVETQGIYEDGTKKTDKKTETTSGAVAPSQLPLPSMPGSQPAVDEKSNKPLTLNQRATRLAQEQYERLGKMGNVPAMMKIIRKALERGYPDQQVNQALAWLAEKRWTLTEEKLANTLRGGPLPAGRNGKPVQRTLVDTRHGPRELLPNQWVDHYGNVIEGT